MDSLFNNFILLFNLFADVYILRNNVSDPFLLD